jgi:hypothetical protein
LERLVNSLMVKRLLISFFITITCVSFSQVKEIVSKDGEIDLPMDSMKNHIYFQFKMNEETHNRAFLLENIPRVASKYLDSSIYFRMASPDTILEYFVVYPCSLIDSVDFHDHKIDKNGYVTASMFIRFEENAYILEIKDLEWVNRERKKSNLDVLYIKYKSQRVPLKQKLYYFGALKSAEYLINETLENYTIILEDIIDEKLGDSE